MQKQRRHCRKQADLEQLQQGQILSISFSAVILLKKENEIFITSKAKQLLSLVPEDLKKPELTAEWESRLSMIAKGKASDRKFMREIATYTKELMKQIQNGTGTFRHDNLTNKICQSVERDFF